MVEGKEIYLTEKAFCVMFDNTKFKVQQKVLVAMKNIYLEQRLKVLKQAIEMQGKVEEKISMMMKEENS